MLLVLAVTVAMACGNAPPVSEGASSDTAEVVTASAPPASDVVVGEMETSQVVYVRHSPNAVVLQASAVGVLHIDPECIVLEIAAPSSRQGLYTLMFDAREPVLVSSPTGPITVQHPPLEVLEGKSADVIQRHQPVTIHDGDAVEFASPNAWSRENLGDDTIALVTQPHESCPETFWVAGDIGPLNTTGDGRAADS
ncbi:hypothetical protein [Candidatus Poriferisodalis sp.]|uniref:hypothetical protein n=1 Tax=Candidatus Poriferisodalis sp. TaxID=3101277 RepID=UPI003B51A5B4